MAVRVKNGEDFEEFLRREGETSIPFHEEDSEGQKRPSIYLGKRMANQVRAGDVVELVVNARATKKGKNLKLGPIRVIQPAPRPENP